jgi:hypothetical protein
MSDTSRFSHTFPICMNCQDGFSKLLQDRGRVGMSLVSSLRAHVLDIAQCQSKIARQEWLEGANVIFPVFLGISQYFSVLICSDAIGVNVVKGLSHCLMLQGRPCIHGSNCSFVELVVAFGMS